MSNEIKRIAILGSTGSIGQQALAVVRAFPDKFRVVALTAGNNTQLLAQQITEFKPKFIHYEGDFKAMPVANYRFLASEKIAAYHDIDLVLVATSGKTGLVPTLAALRAGKTVALANKEALVMAGEIITDEARVNHARLLPVDSEHSAIWQCLDGKPIRQATSTMLGTSQGEPEGVRNLILTASGGPFYNYTPEKLAKVTPSAALKHPSWKMGHKITVDSATLMNKGLEVIEAHWLFDMPFDQIKVLVHPQSIVHSMVEFVDGSVKAQMSYPDMRLPIQYALSYPERWPNSELPHLDWDKTRELTFDQPNLTAFPALNLAIEAGKKGGTYPAVLCAADEIAVEMFLAGRIKFTDIPKLVEKTLSQHHSVAHPMLEEIMEADSWARDKITVLAEAAS